MLSADDVVERLCKLQTEVQEEVVGYGEACDCFCRKAGLWGSAGYGGTFEEGYRNSGAALEFIESAVREKIASLKS